MVFTCAVCNKPFPDRWKLARHAKTHKNQNQKGKYGCSTCPQRFDDQWKADRHGAKHSSDQSQTFTCEICHKNFKFKAWLLRHQSEQHAKVGKQHGCAYCNKKFSFLSKLRVHERTHGERYQCDQCSEPFFCPFAFSRHNCTKGEFGCGACNARFDDDAALARHEEQMHAGSSSDVPGARKRPASSRTTPKMKEKYLKIGETIEEYPEDIRREVARNWSHIQDYEHDREVKGSHNLRTDHFDTDALEKRIRAIYAKHGHAFKIRVLAGGVLKRRADDGSDDGHVRYYYPSLNTSVLDDPVIIGTRAELDAFLEQLRNVDIENLMTQNRTEELPELTNIYKTTGRFAHFSRAKINSVFFRSLAFHKLRGKRYDEQAADPRVRNVETLTAQLFNKWLDFKTQNKDESKLHQPESFKCKPGQFTGVTFDDIPELERCFETNAPIFTLIQNAAVEEEEDGSKSDEETEEGEPVVVKDEFSATLLRDSMRRFKDTMNLNLNNDHFSYIVNRDGYCRSRRCQWCKRYFSRSGDLRRHQKICKGSRTKYQYPGGGYANRPTLFQKLELHGIDVDVERRYFPHRAGYDWECRFANLPESDGKLQFLRILIPASFSLKSNVPGHENTECKLHEDPAELIKQFIDSLKGMAETSYKIMQGKYADIIQKLEGKIGDISALKAAAQSAETQMEEECHEIQEKIKTKQMEGLKDDSEERELLQQIENVKNDKELEELWARYKRAFLYFKLKSELDSWMKQLVILGFNSGRFDLNLIRDHFIPYFMKTYEPGTVKAIKRGTTYMSLASPEMKFLDISLYLGPGISYEKFIKAYGVKATKGYWPYEWFHSFNQLQQTNLPPRSAFYSVLKQREMSEEEYSEVQRIWNEQGFRTMEDMLRWYNNLDVDPLLQGINKMFQNFKNMLNLDIFKQSISLPGLALIHLFDDQNPESFMQLFSKKTKHWEEAIRRNIVGGPSIIFHRRHISGKTRLRHKLGKLVEAVLGYDANALYLWCTGQRMPVGVAIAYEPKTEGGHTVPAVPEIETVQKVKQMINENMRTKFSRKMTDRCKMEIDYVTWKLAELKKQHQREDLTVMHQKNGGQMKFMKGKKAIFVDGYVPQVNLILQFHGCRYHGCDCQQGKMNENLRLEKRQKTEEISQFLRSTGKDLVEEWECDFKKRPGAIEHIKKGQLKGRSGMTARQILSMVQQDTFFGLVECDLQVPWWVPGMREHMDEMAPVFKNVEVKRSDLDEEMRKFAEEHSIMSQPRRSLINSFFGEKILLASPLLKWYMGHGLVVTRVHRCLQFRGEQVFQPLADEVTQHRSDADRDPNKKVLADMYKLLGNSYYGKCLTNKEKQTRVAYMTEYNTYQGINEPLFHTLDEVADDVYEVGFKKKKIKFDLPVLVAYFVYAYAKLKMLSFYYDFLDRVLKREDFEMCEMDTDSLYFACSAKTLEDAIAPERRSIYEPLKKEFLALDPDPRSPTYDMRTPGIFKLEWQGRALIALSSKTYVCFDHDEAVKLSTKGASKQTNPHLQPQKFMDVLDTKTSIDGTNYGFRRYGRQMAFYKQARTALTYFYPKRLVTTDDRTRTLLICESYWLT